MRRALCALPSGSIRYRVALNITSSELKAGLIEGRAPVILPFNIIEE
jgi:hypothetical protein